MLVLKADAHHEVKRRDDGKGLVTLKTANPVTGASVVSAAFRLSPHNALWLADALKGAAGQIMRAPSGLQQASAVIVTFAKP